jgi:hypothetical protein
MRIRTFAAVLVFGTAALACSKDSDTKTVAVSDIPDGAIPRDFEPDPLGTIPPMGDPDPDEPPTQGLAAAAPSGSSSHAPATAPPPASKDGAQKPTFKLLSAGEAPRRKLRYKFVAGQNELVTIDFTMAVAVDAGPDSPPEQKLPAMRFSVLFALKSVSPDGELAYEFQLAGADVAKDPRVPQQVQQGIKAILGQLRGVSGEGFVSARGVVRDATISAPPTVSQQSERFLSQLQTIISDMAPPFPDEEVGKGAKWERSMKIDATDAKILEKSTYTLVDTSDSGGTLSVVSVQTTPGGPPQPAGAAGGIHIDAFAGSGSGTSTFAFNRFAPASTDDVATTISLSGSQGGQMQHAKQTSKTSFKVSGTLAPTQ